MGSILVKSGPRSPRTGWGKRGGVKGKRGGWGGFQTIAFSGRKVFGMKGRGNNTQKKKKKKKKKKKEKDKI